MLDQLRPRSPHQLHAFVKYALKFDVPRRAVVEGHAAPFAYLEHAFFEDRPDLQPRDCVVWANRGGGKTQLGAIATFLDLIFKPGIQVRILGGSFEQSDKMYRSLCELASRAPWRDLVDGQITGKSIALINGSRVEALCQSERSVRGQRVHKLRCDEVELFDDSVWSAAQMVTRSGRCGDVEVRGCIEAFSTMHRPFGLMSRLIDDAAAGRRRLFRWSVLDVMERCEPARRCDACALWDGCRGRARQARGWFSIDDALVQQSRTSANVWATEMLCERPSVADLVYPEFDIAVHVRGFERSSLASDQDDVTWIAGMDFGYRSPTVILGAAHAAQRDLLHIVDEHIASERTVEYHIAAFDSRPWPRPQWIGADPAGRQRNDQTGRSAIAVWRAAGYRVRAQGSAIEPGIDLVRRRLLSGAGDARLLIDPRCTGLIGALSRYHYDPDRVENPHPVKDGPDHAADALRYLIVNLDARRGAVHSRRY